MASPVLEAIYKRRSIREFTDQNVETDLLHEIIRAGIWAPSGLNNQPWRFVIIKDEETRNLIAAQTHYGHIIKAAPALIAVYLDQGEMYNETKDHQAAGACIENMLLATEALGLGSVWLGQILQNKAEVNVLLGLTDNLDLMAVLAIGHPAHHDQKSQRKSLTEFIIKEL
ncbi:MAG: nitroreductase family protein [Desulfobulbaceae bacterium]|nr:nitroreductase family protein [Desulfobulbaceae bacterium]